MLREIDFSVVLNFWFSQAVKPKWFIKDFEFDKLIAQKFENIYSMAKTEKLDQ